MIGDGRTEQPRVSPTSQRSYVSDPAFPVVHPRPARGWLNDPNGPVRWDGVYHLFFQHNPNDAVHGQICWGHLSSDDLVQWREEPLALRPTPGGPDAGGCWSGCVVDDEGVATAVYSGLADANPASTTVCLARAEDATLRRWSADPEPVAAPPEGVVAFRDPFLLTIAGRRHAVVGAGLADGHAAVLLFECEDLRAWTLRGSLLDSRDPVAARVAPGEIWECPQLFALADRWVLLVSVVRGGSITETAYLVGDLAEIPGGLGFLPERGGLVDQGDAFYAPAVLVDQDRVLMWGWAWETRPERRCRAAGWSGILTWPRELELTTDHLLTSRPARELDALRTTALDAGSAQPTAGVSEATAGPTDDGAAAGSAVEHLELPPGAAEVVWEIAAVGPVQLWVDLGGGPLSVQVHPSPVQPGQHPAGSTELEPAGLADPEKREPSSESDATTIRARVVIDGSLVEVFVQGGATWTCRVYPSGRSAGRVGQRGAVRARAAVHRLEVPRP